MTTATRDYVKYEAYEKEIDRLHTCFISINMDFDNFKQAINKTQGANGVESLTGVRPSQSYYYFRQARKALREIEDAIKRYRQNRIMAFEED